MLSYIANSSTAELIKSICKEQDIIILNQTVEQIDFLEYIKKTKVNFNVIKYLILDFSQLTNTEDEIIESISYFIELYPNTRIIIIAQGYDNQNIILTKLYDNHIYNIINNNNNEQVKVELIKCLSQEGIQEKDAKRFKKIEETRSDKNMKNNIMQILKDTIKRIKIINKNGKTQNQIDSRVYFFEIIIDAIKSLIKLLGYIVIFILTSIGMTVIFNEQLRNIVFQIFK